MGKPGAKKTDQIISATPGDVHIIMVPSPGGPVPTPIPHPCSSMIKDKVATKVKVMGQPGAVKGSISKHMPPHIPMGPGPFQKPPANKGEIVTGSSNVFYEGKAAAMLGDTGKMCADPTDAPVGKVIGTAATVLVGGGGSGSDADRAAAAAASMRAATAACHSWINANYPIGSLGREAAHRQLCSTTGHPVDVATGKMITRNVDLELPGRIALALVRNYSSVRRETGPLGWGWRHSYQLELHVQPGFLAHRDANGRFLPFPIPGPGEGVRNQTGKQVLRSVERGYEIEDEDGLIQCFETPSPNHPGSIPISTLKDSSGNTIRFHYEEGRLVRIIDAAGRSIDLRHDEQGRIVHLILRRGAGEADESVRRYVYDDAGDLVQVLDPMDHSYRYGYDRHYLVRDTDRNGFSFYFRYDPAGWCTETWGDEGILYRRILYDQERRTTWVVNSEGEHSLYYWNENGLVEAEIDPLGKRWSFDYDDFQNRTRVADPMGNAWTYTYDADGRLVSRTDPEENIVEIVRDAEGRRTGVIDPAGMKWPCERDSSGILLRQLDPGGAAQGFEWSAQGDLVGMSDPLGRRTAYAYDDAGNMVRRENHRGALVRRSYATRGLLLEERDDGGVRVALGYDGKGRVVTEFRRDKGERRFELDPEGNICQVIDPLGRATRFEYGRFDKLLRRLEPATGGGHPETRLAYDSENRIREIVYPGGETAAYGYDADGRIAWKRRADGSSMRYVRDDAGRVIEIHDGLGLLIKVDRDGLGREVRREVAGGATASFAYDPLGRITEAENAAGVVSLAYDPYGRVVRERGPNGAARYRYDAAGRLSAIGFGKKYRVYLRWSGTNLLLKTPTGQVELSHDILGRLIATRAGARLLEERRLGSSGFPDVVRVPWGERWYKRDESRAIVEATETDGTHLLFDRDSRRRILRATREGPAGRSSHAYTYDSAGNRGREGEAFLFSPGNRLNATSADRMDYDERGFLRSWKRADGTRLRLWHSPDGRLMRLQAPDLKIRYQYDPFGRRVSKTVNREVTRFAWEGTRLVHEWRPDGEERHYLYHPESHTPLLCHRRFSRGPWAALYFLNDARGCPEALLNDAGEIVWRARIGPFGEVDQEEGEIDQPLALPGQYRDRETGLVYNLYRYYSPQLTQFLTPDPLGHLGGSRLYGYPDDPLTQVDILGLSSADYDPTQKTPHRIVEINGVKYVEFDAKDGFTSGSNINVGGSGDPGTGSVDHFVSIGPDGEVVVMEGRHRAVAAAAGDEIPEDQGGRPGMPGHLRYPLGEEGNFETTDSAGPSLASLAADPKKLAAARSGKR